MIGPNKENAGSYLLKMYWKSAIPEVTVLSPVSGYEKYEEVKK
jgi:hypothetical protein